jgi:hypothetical protein
VTCERASRVGGARTRSGGASFRGWGASACGRGRESQLGGAHFWAWGRELHCSDARMPERGRGRLGLGASTSLFFKTFQQFKINDTNGYHLNNITHL